MPGYWLVTNINPCLVLKSFFISLPTCQEFHHLSTSFFCRKLIIKIDSIEKLKLLKVNISKGVFFILMSPTKWKKNPTLIRACVRNLKLKVLSVLQKRACGCQLVLDASKLPQKVNKLSIFFLMSRHFQYLI